MDFSKVDFWIVFLNISGICLWGITMLYFLLKNKEKHIWKVFRGKDNKTSVLSFDDEIFAQMVKQQVERSFRQIYHSIKKERELLGMLNEDSKINKTPNIVTSDPYFNKRSKFASRKRKNCSKIKKTDKYSEAVRFADLGMSAKKISQKVRVPVGEIELLLKLREQKRKRKIPNTSHVEAFS